MNIMPQFLKMLFFIFCCIGFTSCNAQDSKDEAVKKDEKTENTLSKKSKLIRTLGTHEGDNIHCSLQDKNGNLWFGTTGEGVYKYDGESFVQFTSDDGLSGNLVWCMVEDKDGKIWMGTDGGPCYYDGYNFTQLQIIAENPLNFDLLIGKNEYSKRDVFSIIQDQSSTIWFASINGVFTYDGEDFTSFAVNNNKRGFMNPTKNNVEHILEDKSGNIWFGGRVNKGVYKYDGKSITNITLKELNGHDWAWPVLQDKDGNMWFSNWGGAYRYDGHSFEIFNKEDGLFEDTVIRIIEDQSGELWFSCGGVESGICRYDGDSFKCLTKKDGLKHPGVWSILQDNEGAFWIGTTKMGLYRFDGSAFTLFSE